MLKKCLAFNLYPDDVITPGRSTMTADCGESSGPSPSLSPRDSDSPHVAGSDSATTGKHLGLAAVFSDLCHLSASVGKHFELGANLGQ